jgi:hypothetical protein
MRANSAATIRNLVTAIPEQRLRALVAEVAISALRCLMTGAPEPATTTPPASTDKMRRHWSQPRRAAHNAKRREKRQLAKAAAHVRQPAPDSAGKSTPEFCFAIEASRPPTVPLIEPSILLAPSITTASCPEQSGIVVADHDDFVRSPLR